MPHEVFITYSSTDKLIADAVCARLEAAGLRCWIAPRDISPGQDWTAAILSAIESSSAIVLVFSTHANESPHVKREVERGIHKGVAVIPFRIEDVRPSASLEYLISTAHWLDAITPPVEQHIQRLAEAIGKLLGKEIIDDAAQAQDLPRSSQLSHGNDSIQPSSRLLRGANRRLGAALAIICLGCVTLAGYIASNKNPSLGIRDDNIAQLPPSKGQHPLDGIRGHNVGPADLAKQSEFHSEHVGNRVALVVGIDEYDSGELLQLQYAISDARAVAEALSNRGFKLVKCPNNPNRGQLTDAIVAFQQVLGLGGVGIFYFSGHGMQVDNRDYLVPRDGMPGSISTLVDATELLKPIDDILKNPPPNNGTVIMYSTEAGGVSFELPEIGGSPFAAVLLRLIESGDTNLTDMLPAIRKDVVKRTNGRQTPWMSSSIDTDFFFCPKARENIGLLKIVLLDACRNDRNNSR